MVETGLMEIDDPALAERLRALKTKRHELQQQIDSASSGPAQQNRLTEAKIAKLSAAVCTAFRQAPPEVQKAYLKLFVDQVVISKDEIRISGPKAALVLAATTDMPNTSDGVITFIRAWRPGGGDDEHYVYAIALP